MAGEIADATRAKAFKKFIFMFRASEKNGGEETFRRGVGNVSTEALNNFYLLRGFAWCSARWGMPPDTGWKAGHTAYFSRLIQ
jgi:hypothetical protein